MAGDTKYGLESLNRALAQGDLPDGLARNSRMFLHAARLALPHPEDGRELVLQADWPVDDARWLQRLARLCGGEQAALPGAGGGR